MTNEGPLFTIENNSYGFKCAIHGDLKKVFTINNELHCPHCMLQFFLVNDIFPNEPI